MRTDNIAYGKYCNMLPSADLCKVLCETFKEKYPKIFSVFSHQILPYKNVDLSSAAIPALLIYPVKSVTTSESWYMQETLFFDFIFPGGALIRERSTEIANVIAESVIFLILKNQNFFDELKFGPPDEFGIPTGGKFPALKELGEKIDVDFSDANSLTNRQDSVTIRLRVSYTIDTMQWWEYIQEIKGHNIFDPCQSLYPLIESYMSTLNLVSFENNGENNK